MEKTRANLNRIEEAGIRNKLCVLVTTGAMNPVHRGHVHMLSAARTTIEAEGWHVLAGFISPSHELYVKPKCERFKTPYMSTSDRLELVRLAVQDSDWLDAGAWESSPTHARWPDFGPTVENLAKAIEVPPKYHVHCFYVCGLDHFQK